MTAGQNVNILKRNTKFSNQKNTKPRSMLPFQSFKKEWEKLAHPRCKPEPVKPTGDVKQRKQRRQLNIEPRETKIAKQKKKFSGSYTEVNRRNESQATKFHRPFPSSPGPLYQNEVKCSALDMEMICHSHTNKTHFHKKRCAFGLILKERVFGTRKSPILFACLQFRKNYHMFITSRCSYI